MNISDFLKLDISKSFTLIAGFEGITNPISGVNILDNPNATDWLSSGELIVTSGYFFKDNEKKQKEYLTKFKDINISGICIKEKVYFNTIPKYIIDLCNSYNIPLIEVPYGISFSKIIHVTLDHMSESIDEAKQFAIETQSNFFKLALNDTGTTQITNEISNSISQIVYILDSNWTLISTSEKNSNSNFLNEILIQIKPLLPELINQLEHPIYRNIKYEKKEYTIFLFPIYFNTLNYGYIIIPLLNNRLTNQDISILANSAMSVALKLVQENELKRIENKMWRNQFIKFINKELSLAEFIKRNNLYLNSDYNYSIINLSITIDNNTSLSLLQLRQNEQRLFEGIHDFIQNKLPSISPYSYSFRDGTNIIILYASQSDKLVHVLKKEIKSFINNLFIDLHAIFSQKFNIFATIGSSKPLDTIKESYNEVHDLLSLFPQSPDSIIFSDELYFESFIGKILSLEKNDDYIKHYLGPLITYDKNNNGELIHTLATYINNHYSIKKSSDLLFIHRNTLLYRINKITELLPVDFNNPTNSLAIQLALYMHKKR